MEPRYTGQVTALLKRWAAGDHAVQDELIPLVYQELRDIAGRRRRKSGAVETFQTTALASEAYLRLVDIDAVTFNDRAHFFAISANVMRRILIDQARPHLCEARRTRAPQVFRWIRTRFQRSADGQSLAVSRIGRRPAGRLRVSNESRHIIGDHA